MQMARSVGVFTVAALGVACGTIPVVTETSRARFDDVAIVLAIACYVAVGLVIALARPGHPVGRTMLSGGVLWGVGEGLVALSLAGLEDDASSASYAFVGVLGTAARGTGWLLLVLALPLIFPDGWPPGRRARSLVVAALGAFSLGALLAPVPLEDRLQAVSNPIGLSESWRLIADLLALGGLALAFAGLVIAVRALVRRWRAGDPLLRQQVLLFSVSFALPLLVLPLTATPLIRPWMFALATLPIPVAVSVAIFHRRLYDVQLAVSRTLTYLALTAVLAGMYALVVGGVGVMLRDRGAAWLPWVAAGVVAVTFAPLRESLQRAVNTLTYGRWARPAEVLSDTGRRLADAADGHALLTSLTDELVDGLGLAFAEIRDAAGRTLASSGPDAGNGVEQLPLTAFGGEVGSLRWSGQSLRETDRVLLEDIAHQIGGAVHTVALVDALRDAQDRLVRAREQERRRLRHDLHDGLGPALAGLGLQLDAISNLVEQGRPVGAQLTALRSGLSETVTEVRRIVDGLRPPAIDDLGLFGALAELGHRLVEGAGLHLDLDLPPCRPELPAAVEVTAYRVGQEALTNVVRHSGAARCRITATLTEEALVLKVSDDGCGGAEPGPGLGIPGMGNRARELGGTLRILATNPGTLVELRLPIHAETRS